MAKASLRRKVIRQFFVTVSDHVPARSPLSQCAPKFGGVSRSSPVAIAVRNDSIFRRRPTVFALRPFVLPVSAKRRSSLWRIDSISTGYIWLQGVLCQATLDAQDGHARRSACPRR